MSLDHRSIAISVDASGIYRVSGGWLATRGIIWSGTPARDVTLSFEGHPVRRYMSTSGDLTQRSYIEFYAPPFSTMYTSTAVYVLSRANSGASSIPSIPSGAQSTGSLTSYEATDDIAPQPGCAKQNGGCIYEPAAPNEKWFYNEIIANGAAGTLTTSLRLNHIVAAGQASLALDVWGVTDFNGSYPQHDIKALVNGHQVMELTFSGSVEQASTARFPEAWLKPGANAIKLVLPGAVQNQYDLDIIDVSNIDLSYARELEAVNGRLDASFPVGQQVTISGLSNGKSQVWLLSAKGPEKVTGAKVTAISSGSYKLSFVTPEAGEYLIEQSSAVETPLSATPMAPTPYLLQGKANLLIISPRSFWKALAPLIAYHEHHGVTVKLADVHDVFDHFSHGLFDANAIREYIGQAITNLGISSVLLVGVDTYDYQHYLDCAHNGCPFNPSDESLVPSMYTTDSYFGQVPSDELYVDDGDVPGIAIGRIPALTSAQVKTVVKHDVELMKSPPKKLSAVTVAGTGDSSFSTTSDTLASSLPAAYSITTLDQPPKSHSAVRKALLSAVHSGVTIADFFGHGNLEQWDQNPVLSVGDVPRLKPEHPGQLYLGWGCQTAYDVDPTDRALNARLLFDGGAALTLGSTGLDLANPQSELAIDFYTEMFHDPAVTSVGQALEVAEQKAYAEDAGTSQAIRSYEIFGDPAIPTSIFR